MFVDVEVQHGSLVFILQESRDYERSFGGVEGVHLQRDVRWVVDGRGEGLTAEAGAFAM